MIAIRGALCAALFLGAALPAPAQQTQQPPAMPAKASEFETVSLAVYGPCSRASAADAAAAEAMAAACLKLLGDLDMVRQAAGTIAGHDLNIFNLLKSTGNLRVSNAWLKLDNNIRTARVCGKVEEAWAFASKIDLAASPAAYAGDMKTLVGQVVGITRTCRTEHEWPANATPLPAQ